MVNTDNTGGHCQKDKWLYGKKKVYIKGITFIESVSIVFASFKKNHLNVFRNKYWFLLPISVLSFNSNRTRSSV